MEGESWLPRWWPGGVLAWLGWTGLEVPRLAWVRWLAQQLLGLQRWSQGGAGGVCGPCRRLQHVRSGRVIALWRRRRSISVLVSLRQDVEKVPRFLPLILLQIILTMANGVQGRVLRSRGRWIRLGRLVRVRTRAGIKWRRCGRLLRELVPRWVRGRG